MEDFEIIDCASLRGKMLDKNEFTLFEIGPDADCKAAHLPNAIGVQPELVRDLVPELVSPEAPFDEIILYDAGQDDAAAQAARELVAIGYKNVKILRGGKKNWIDAGLPLEGPEELPHPRIA